MALPEAKEALAMSILERISQSQDRQGMKPESLDFAIRHGG